MLEVIIAISVIATGLVAVLALVAVSISTISVSRERLIANYLAQEGVEIVRNIRDNNWLSYAVDWKQNIKGNASISDYTYTVQHDGVINLGVDSIDIEGARLKIDASGFYSHGAGQDTPFYRLITVTNPSPEQLDVRSAVKWRGHAPIVVEEVLYDWK